MTDTELIQCLRKHTQFHPVNDEAADRLEQLTTLEPGDRETRGLSDEEVKLLVPSDTVRCGTESRVVCDVDAFGLGLTDDDHYVYFPGKGCTEWEAYIPTGATLERLRPKQETLREALVVFLGRHTRRSTVLVSELLDILDRFPSR